ncbi:MAG: DNA-3-methyladenine glycosylase 2 family protein [Clostridiales bacterium]|nr:DNA-3-methyladenine glycosylase 2 family protein [Clostridiales bacterium]
MFLETNDIDLKLMLMDSAQSFMWMQADGGYGAVLHGRAVYLKEDGACLYAEGMDEMSLRRYLGLARDYDALRAAWRGDPVVSRCMDACPGLCVMEQPAWETVVMFILSANNNVARIRKLTHALQTRYGETIETEHGAFYAMPTADRLASLSEEELRALGVGYRAPYLIGAARMVRDGFPLDALMDRPYEAAHAELLRLPGVGDKVADCILLFGCGHAEAFPTDVWIERLLKECFGIKASNRRALAARARERFGPQAGVVQQFLFHAARMRIFENNELLTPAD